MSKYFHIGLVFLYINLGSCCLLLVLVFSGLPMTDATCLTAMAGWMLICYSAAWFKPGIFLFLHSRARRPILEDERLERVFREVAQRANCDPSIHLLIEEEMSVSAYAIGRHTVVLSKGMLKLMTEQELKGIIAHELGHLTSKDCVAGAAFVMASELPRIMTQLYRIVVKWILYNGWRIIWLVMGRVSFLLGLAIVIYLVLAI